MNKSKYEPEKIFKNTVAEHENKDFLANVFKPLPEKKVISVNYKSLGIPEILYERGGYDVKKIVYYKKVGVKWVTTNFYDILKAFKEALDLLNALLIEDNKEPIKMTLSNIQQHLSGELIHRAVRVGAPKDLTGLFVINFSNGFLVFDRYGNFAFKNPKELELLARTSLPYEFSEEFIQPISWSELSQMKPGENLVLDWLMKTCGDDWNSQDVWDYARFRLQTWGLALTSSSIGIGFIFLPYGPTNTGKSGEIMILRELLGDKNYTCIQLEELADYFQLPQLDGVMANLPDDMGNISPTLGRKLLGVLKKITSFNRIDLKPKRKPPYEAHLRCRFWFPTNCLPELPEKGDVLQSRIRVLPFNTRVMEKNAPKNRFFYLNFLKENKKILRRMALGGFLDYVQSDQKLHSSKLVNDATREYLDYLEKKYSR